MSWAGMCHDKAGRATLPLASAPSAKVWLAAKPRWTYFASVTVRAEKPGDDYQTSLETAMSWKAPKVVEIALGAEINSYACADATK